MYLLCTHTRYITCLQSHNRDLPIVLGGGGEVRPRSDLRANISPSPRNERTAGNRCRLVCNTGARVVLQKSLENVSHERGARVGRDFFFFFTCTRQIGRSVVAPQQRTASACFVSSWNVFRFVPSPRDLPRGPFIALFGDRSPPPLPPNNPIAPYGHRGPIVPRARCATITFRLLRSGRRHT